MSFVKLSKNFQEYSTIVLHPNVSFISSSSGITGSQYISHVRTNTIKDYEDHVTKEVESAAGSISYDESSDTPLQGILKVNGNTVTGLNPDNPIYLNAVNNSPVTAKFKKKILIKRIEPGKVLSFNKDQSIKNTIRKNLYTSYKSKYPDMGWHYSNYHTLNFFKTDSLPDDSCLMYPNDVQQYTPTSSFSLSFHINPRYDNEVAGNDFEAGTIFHMSSSIAVSIVSGSRTDKQGKVSSYKLLLQLSQSADLNPDNVDLSSPSGNYPNDLIFLSDIEMSKNTWNHVTIRWSPQERNASGSIVINRRQTHFNIPSESVSTSAHSLVIGNYYNGNPDNFQKYFNINKKKTEGTTSIGSDLLEPSNQSNNLANPLQAEIHNVMLFDKYLTDGELLFLEKSGINSRKLKKGTTNNLYKSLLFYLPPYFLPDSPERSDILTTPYETIAGKTTTPFNIPFSYGISGRIINLENFVADIAQTKNLRYPRLQSLTGSIIQKSQEGILTADNYIFNSSVSPQIKKRNLTILPNDNGLFRPDYYPILASYHASSSFYKHTIKSFVSKSEGGNSIYNFSELEDIYDYSKISLENLTSFSRHYHRTAWMPGTVNDELDVESLINHSNFANIFGPYEDKTIIRSQAQLNLYALPAILKDVSSNEITLFDISQLFYGNAIKDESFSIVDTNLSGSDNKIKIMLKDNGKGSLYRADSLTKHAKWNNVGDIINEEGIVNILSPHLIKFCKDKTNINFKGEQSLHTMILNVPALKEYFNSSSNKTFTANPPTTASNENHLTTQYITGINIHDNNFNIIMKAHFSQPIVKTEEDEFIIRLKQDF
jgi:hypothetical protein